MTLGLWRGSHGRPGDADGTLDYTRCLYLLFQAARLAPAAMAQAIAPLRDDIVFNHVTLHIIEDALAQALDVYKRQARHRHALGVQGLVFAHHVGHADPRMQRVQPVDAGAQHVLARRFAQGFPVRDQDVLARPRAVGDGEALGLAAGRQGGQPDLLGQGVALERCV